ncbi:MAG: helix-turn-helix transcriptional regulator [Lentisphaeria bacterium]|nr:helix-turn-helix transcriptional regulator [Lentisphaeria bacterium]
MDFYDGLTFSMSGSVPGSMERVHNVPRYYGIQFNFSGTLRLRVDFGRLYEVSGPHVFLTYPGHFFEYGPADAPRHHNYICTCGPRIRKYREGGLWVEDPAAPPIPVPHGENFLRIMQEIMTITRAPGLTAPRAVLLFEDLLLRIREAATMEHRHVPYQAEALNALIRRIGAEPERPWDFASEAEKLHVTSTHFRRIFKEITGLPPQQFLLHGRLNKAAELLKSSRDSVKEIAAAAGWDNVFYFSRLFRRKYFLAPVQYRREFHS